MGEKEVIYHQEAFSPEELAALGDAPAEKPADSEKPAEPKKAPESPEKVEGEVVSETKSETELTKEENKEIKKTGARFEDGYVIDEDGAKIPLKRFKEVYHEAQEGKRIQEKYDLLRQSPEEYYQRYPDEKPVKQEVEQPVITDPMNLVATYKDPNHPYQGRTLAEIYQVDAAEGRRLERSWETTNKGKIETAERRRQEVLEKASQEEVSFEKKIEKEIFTEGDKSTPDQRKAKVNDVKWQVLDFMKKRLIGNLEDAWLIMNKDDIISKAKQEAATAAVEALTKKAVGSIGNGGDGGTLTGFDSYMGMSELQLTDAIDKLTDKQTKEFFKKAPDALKKKYPSIPWG